MICVRIHRGPDGRSVLAACDEGLLGMSFSEGKLRLKVHESFYREDRVDESGLAAMMKGVDIMNLVGEDAVSVAVSEGYVDRANIITIEGIAHTQVVKG